MVCWETFFSGHSFDDGVVGKALKQPICTFRFSGGVNMVRAGNGDGCLQQLHHLQMCKNQRIYVTFLRKASRTHSDIHICEFKIKLGIEMFWLVFLPALA